MGFQIIFLNRLSEVHYIFWLMLLILKQKLDFTACGKFIGLCKGVLKSS